MKARSPKSHPRAGLPTVNLLSPSAFERLAVRRLRQRFLAAGVVLVLLVAGAWGVQHLRVAEAEQMLAVEKAETARLAAETQALAPVRAYVTGVAAQKKTMQEVMAREIFFSEVLDGLEAASPSGVKLTSVGVTLALDAPLPGTEPDPAAPADPDAPVDPAAPDPEEPADPEAPVAPPAPAAPTVSPCPGPDPFNTRVVVGCVTLSGTAASRADVGRLVVALGKDVLFVEPFISTTTTADASEVSFSGSVGLSQEVFSGRYADLETMLAGRVAP